MEKLEEYPNPNPTPTNTVELEYILDLSDYPELDYCLARDGFIIIIVGRKDFGKTDMTLLLDEYCYQQGYRKIIATNIWTQSYIIERRIDNAEDLTEWLNKSGRKLFNLDEGGKVVKARRAMSNPNLYWQDIADLIRHYDAGLTVSTPRAKTLDPTLLDSDICDILIKKVSRTTAYCWDYLSETEYKIDNIPKTHIKFNSKDIASFTQKKKIPFETLPLCCQVASVYAKFGSYKQVKAVLNNPKVADDQQIHRLLIEHCNHTSLTTNK